MKLTQNELFQSKIFILLTKRVIDNKKFVQISSKTDLEELTKQHPWLLEELLVAKPDQLIKR